MIIQELRIFQIKHDPFIILMVESELIRFLIIDRYLMVS